MANIKKIKEGTATIYPATIPQAVVDPTSGKTVRAELDEKATSAELSQLAGDVSVKITNSVVNGDMSNGTAGWFSGFSTNSISAGVLINTGNGAGAEPNASVSVGSKVVGRKYYIRATVKAKSAVCTRIRIILPEIVQIINNPIVDNAYQMSGVITAINTSASLNIYHLYPSAADASGKAMEIDNTQCINLGVFGTGNEPTKEEMDLLISILGVDYFEGEITIPAQKVMQWQLKMIRQNRNAIVALGGTII